MDESSLSMEEYLSLLINLINSHLLIINEFLRFPMVEVGASRI